MSEKPFHFKQFTVNQDKTAMKVGTDGVLLGAWVKIHSDVFSVLDIGAGTGLVGLMIAQRSNAELIDAVELDDNAYEQTVENFEASDWGDRLFCYHASIQEFVLEIEDKYDLIISNPPYFNSTYKELSTERAMARHTDSLSYEELLSSTASLLSENGTCAFVIPFLEESKFVKIAEENKLKPIKITRVKGTKETVFKRVLIQFSFSQIEMITEDELILEEERHVYTSDYKELVQEFYLKLK